MKYTILADIKEIGLIQGVYSASIKAVTTAFRLYLIRLVCQHYAPSESVLFLFFLSVITVAPFLDLGIGGLFFRRRIIEEGEHVFIETFVKLIQLFSLVSLVGLIVSFAVTKHMVVALAFAVIFFRVPFQIQNEYLFAKNKHLAVYGIEIFEQLFLLSMVYIIAQSTAIEYMLLYYGLALVGFHIVYFLAFLKFQSWTWPKIFQKMTFNLSETIYSIQALLSSSFLNLIPFIITSTQHPTDAFEFNIGYRFVSIGLGLSLVLFNPMTSKFILYQKERKEFPIETFILFLTFSCAFGFLLYNLSYEFFFQFLASKLPQNGGLKAQLFFWSLCVYLFMAFDQLLRVLSIRASVLFWLIFYSTVAFLAID